MTQTDKLTAVQTSAGRGTRCRPLNLYSATSMIPKGLMRIMGVPLAELQIEQFKAAGIKENYVITQFLENREHLSNRFGNGSKFDMNIFYSDPIDDRTNNGSAEAILTNIEKRELTGDSIILANDNIYEVDIAKALKWHKRNNAVVSVMTVLLRPRETIKSYGLVSTDGYKITNLLEKPSNEEELMKALEINNPEELTNKRVPINTAGYIVNNEFIREISKEDWIAEGRKKGKGLFDMASDFIVGLIKRGYPVFNSPINAWGDFGSATYFLDTFPDALGGKFPFIHHILENQGYYYHDSRKNVWIHLDSLNRKDKTGKTLLERMDNGRVSIGPNVFIGRQSIIEDDVEISYSNLEKYALIGKEVRLNRAYLSPYCQIGPHAELRDCALGLQVIVDSTQEAPTYINSRSVIGPEIQIPAGSKLLSTEVFPGFVFDGPQNIRNARLKPTPEQIGEVLKLYQ